MIGFNILWFGRLGASALKASAALLINDVLAAA